MSSTEQTLRAFYEAEILPLQDKLPLAQSDTAPAENSYFLDRSGEAVSPSTFLGGLNDPASIAAAMDAHWAGTPLAGMGAKLMDLAQKIDAGEETAKVSELVYEMF